MSSAQTPNERSAYAISVANDSYEWYKRHTMLARRAYKLSEIAVISISAAVPATLAIDPDQTILVAILGAVVVVISGLRSVYHWQDDYLRFSQAREAVEAERRLYRMGSGKYVDVEARDAILVEAITRIEQQETREWAKIATPPTTGDSDGRRLRTFGESGARQ